jgi:Glycosyl hydrolase family 26
MVTACTAAPGAACPVSALLVPTCGAWWGMYVPTLPSGQGLPSAVAGQDSRLGRPLDVVERYHDMSQSPDGIFPNRAEQQVGRRHLLLFDWAPVVWSTHTQYPWGAIASGALDRSVIVPEAERLRAYRRKVFLSFGAESDTSVSNADTPAAYVAAWRHIHDVFARLQVHNVVWVWTTTGYLPHTSTIAAMYPGNAYVNWIGYDPYNTFTCSDSPWQDFAQTVGPFYRWLSAKRFDKPIMLAEYGSAPDSAEPKLEASWYSGIVPALQLYPHIKALILWNAATTQCDFRLSSMSAVARAAYRQTGLSPYLRQRIP